jgi:hypothetical protein
MPAQGNRLPIVPGKVLLDRATMHVACQTARRCSRGPSRRRDPPPLQWPIRRLKTVGFLGDFCKPRTVWVSNGHYRGDEKLDRPTPRTVVFGWAYCIQCIMMHGGAMIIVKVGAFLCDLSVERQCVPLYDTEGGWLHLRVGVKGVCPREYREGRSARLKPWASWRF